MGKTAAADPLRRYTAKRNFAVTPEPDAVAAAPAQALSFVVQKHWASRLHYDFRLELDGVLLSWAVPKGPCFDPSVKRMAVHVEDHPVSYGGFEGTIPPRQYGAGTVIVWDRGTWEPVGDPQEGMARGKLVFKLHGEKLAGLWELVRIAKPGDKQDPWMLFKKRDAWARPLADYDVIAALPDSVIEKPLGPVEQRQPRGNGAASPAPAAAVRTAAELPGAVKALLPDSLSPQLATLASAVPSRGEWLYELKLDGYRMLARIEHGRARLFTRQGNDWTAKLKPLAAAVESLGLRSAWLDGEIVVLNDAGTPSFNALQNAFDASRTETIRYFLFDLPYFDGHDLRDVPLHARRALLKQLVDTRAAEPIRFSADFAADPVSLLQSAQALGLEGIVAKRADAPYVSRRSESWLKLKVRERQEFVVGGFTDREGSSREIGSLLLGYRDADGVLRHAGSVGTGWDSGTATSLHKRLVPLEVPQPPFAAADLKPGRWSRRPAGSERWVQPKLVIEVSFADWTPDGRIRHAVFQGVRTDKPARSVTRERAVAVPVANQAAGGNRVGAVTVSNPDRVIDPSTGLKKLDLVRYVESVAERMLPHLKGRPVSLVRGPTGVTGELFFQKHDDKLTIPGLRELDPAMWPGHPPLLEVPNAQALISAAQMNVIEFHTWNSTTKTIDRPDRIVFDLDPGEGVAWTRVQEAALLTHTLLDELGLKAWLKTSGGKGLHVVVPFVPKLDYDTVKAFSQAVVQHLARTVPSRFVAKSGAANRIGKVFVDYLRNGRGATTAAAFSARARPGLGVSMPVSWEQLPSLKGGAQWTIATAREYLSFEKSDPWADYWKTRQTLAAATKRLGSP
ncbi:DNA ligase D [Piscinibacter sp.]|uniref:DNA ligase D n=1 Tax=Piscinibacter sp. TaxID=1903157 RepID=UPI002BF3DE47|nr:DNA ligase D [Albitalea sp.]HUG23552.1 DNA ligase D [Albitalea sp.]